MNEQMLFTNAGIGAAGSVQHVTDEDWDRCLAVCLSGVSPTRRRPRVDDGSPLAS